MSHDRKSTILVVDDEPGNTTLLSTTLTWHGYEVAIAPDGQSALRQVSEVKPDLILLDVMMPGLDGFETCRRLKAREETKHIPIIFMTALSETTNELKGLELGAVDYVTRPFEIKTVLARAKTHITLRRLQLDLEESNRQLQQKNEELDAFSWTVAHDLKSLISGSMSHSNFLAGNATDLSPQEIVKLANAIHRYGRQAATVIDELMLLAGIRKTEITLEPIDMPHVVRRALERLVLMIQKAQADIILPPSWPVALGYAPWLEEVWLNYLSNGLKYGGTPPRLELGASPQGDGFVRFWVKDSGSGIAAADQAKLFAEFTHLSDVQLEGYGLGLSIVRRIVEKLGGQAGVDSIPGQGSTFYFTLPQPPQS